MVVGMVVITFAGIKIMSSFKNLTISNSNHMKRDDQVFLPMIPGVTLPMSHIGYYLLALMICGLFHEAGHAIASFTEGIPIQSSGMFILYLYPGAFVSIPDQPLQTLAPFRQLKIVCAGVWHNLVLYGFTTIALAGGLKLLLVLMGWQSLESGVSVVHVRTNSPLAMHLPPSTWIHQLDDTPLTHSIEDWNAFLFKDDGRHTLDLGFCVSKQLEDYGKACCDVTDDFPFGQSTDTSISCFQTLDQEVVDQYCLPTLPVLAIKSKPRCYKTSDCNGTEKCIVPYTPSSAGQLVRIYAQYPYWIEGGAEKIFIFEGELVDIWESALALLNILPAFKLDGEFALEQILLLIIKPTENIVTTTRTNLLIRKIQDMIIKVTSILVGFVIAGSLVMGLISSI